jgi:hypothetical protein
LACVASSEVLICRISNEIETVTEFNYLGVTFTKNGKFKLAKQKNIEKATKATRTSLQTATRTSLQTATRTPLKPG